MVPEPPGMVFGAGDDHWDFEVRAMVYGLLARIFLAPPDPDLLQTLRHPGILEEWPWGRGNPRVEEGLDRLRHALSTSAVDGLTEEYRELFWGPGPVLAPPWESVYLDREHVVFGAETLQVRALFRRFGLESRQLNQEPDDHIGLQLQFLAHLSAQTSERLKEGDWATASSYIDGQRECVEAHLLRFVHLFAERLFQHGCSDFYKGAAALMMGTIDVDRNLLGRLTAAAGRVENAH